MSSTWSADFNIEGKVTVVVGATGLIGRALSQGFARAGGKLVLAAKTRAKGRKLEKTLKEQGHDVCFHPVNIASPRSIDTLIDFVRERFGRIDVWVNNAFPRTDDWPQRLEDLTHDSLQRNIAMHLEGYFLCCQKIGMAMQAQGRGNIINVGSVYGLVAPDFSVYEGTDVFCSPVYPAIKGGITALTRYLATYYAKDNIRVNCLCPGGILDNQDPVFIERYSARTPLGRMGRPEEIVGPALFLASDASSYVTGHVLVVDGGLTVW